MHPRVAAVDIFAVVAKDGDAEQVAKKVTGHNRDDVRVTRKEGGGCGGRKDRYVRICQADGYLHHRNLQLTSVLTIT